MENKIEKIIKEIQEMCKEANMTNPINIIHFLIAYLVDKNDKDCEDYAVNSVIAYFIYEICTKMKNETIIISKKELITICNSFIINGIKDELKEHKICENNDDELKNNNNELKNDETDIIINNE